MTVRILPGGIDDVPALMPVMQAAFDPHYGEAWTAEQVAMGLGMPDVRLTLAWDGGGGEAHLVGFALVRRVLDEAELLLLATAPGWQGRGIGSRLVDTVLDNAALFGVRRLFLEVRENNRAHQFYASSGFTPIGRRPGYYRHVDGGVQDAITMARSL